MEFVRPPTDNLYKFVAIAGLLLFLISAIFPLLEVWEVDRRTARVSARIEWINSDMEQMAPGVHGVVETLREMQAGMDTLSESESDSSQERSEAITERWALAQLEDAAKIRERLGTAYIDNQELLALAEQRLALAYMGRGGMILGALIAAAGFLAWYKKVQRYEDAILRKRAQMEEE